MGQSFGRSFGAHISFREFAVGYADLVIPILRARLTQQDFERLRIGRDGLGIESGSALEIAVMRVDVGELGANSVVGGVRLGQREGSL